MSIKKTIEIEARVDKAEKDLEGVAAGVQSIDKNLKDVKKSSSVAAKGIRGIGTALKAAGIGLVISLLGELKEVFSSNQRVADGFSTVLETISVVFNQVATAAFNVYDQITDTTGSFDAMGKVIKGLFTLALTPLKLAFYGINLAVKKAQLMWEESFFGDNDPETVKRLKSEIAETKTNIVEVGKAAAEAGKSIVNNFSEAVSEAGAIGTAIVEELGKIDLADAKATAEANVRAEKASKLATARNRIILEQKDREAEKLRQIRDDESATIEDRIKANNDLALVLKEQERLMLKNADAILNAAQAQFDKNGNDENALALLEAKAEKEGILAQITGFQSEQLTNVNGLERERLDLIDEANEKIAEDIKIEDERIASIQKLTDFQILTTVEKLQRDRDTALAELELLNATEEEKQKVRDHYAQQEVELSELTTTQKLNLAADALGNIATIAGEESKVGKAAAIAQATISTYLGAQEAFSSLAGIPVVGPALGALAAGAAIVSGIATVKKIASTKTPSGSSGGGASISAPQRATSSAAAPPAFNVVGASETNQLAQSIGQEEKQPLKAFVVSNDVTDAQALDRNIVENASIG